jgi:hypothetical protein
MKKLLFALLCIVTLASCTKEECLPTLNYAQPYNLGVATYVFYEDGSAVAIDYYLNEIPCRYELSADGMLVVNLAAAPKFGWNPTICAFQTNSGQVLR